MPCSSQLISNGDTLITNNTSVNNFKILYHLGITSENTNFSAEYGDVKFVCLGGSYTRIRNYAKQFSQLYGYQASCNLCKTDRYEMYKTGPVLWANHGIGGPSLSIILDEILQMLLCAGATNFEMFRLGTSGGIGVQPGTVIVSNGAINTALEPYRYQWIGGELVKRPAILDQQLCDQLYQIAQQQKVPVVKGVTLCADDFYESAICCVALVNRFEENIIKISKEFHEEAEMRPFKIISEYIHRKLNLKNGKEEEENNITL
uniref:Nucleoside phosphorylase domain-containing protein n=1 Tax=Meloidogyne floridensis TaxID=298350 RepID=A0A915NXK0_9BILA